MISSSLVTDAANAKLGVRYQEEHGYWRITVYPLPDNAARETIESSAVPPGFAWDIENLQSVFDCIEGLDGMPFLPTGPKIPTSGSTESFRATRSISGFCPGNPIRLSRGEV